MTPVHDPSFEPFHSAVNRIPVLRTASSQDAQENKLPRELFSDEMAVGHDYLAPERLSGRIDLKLTVRTPLVCGEQTGGTSGRSVAIQPDATGKPFVPPTMVKGMISRAYEALTCSRFRVFDTHSKPLTYRDRRKRNSYNCSPHELAAYQEVLPLQSADEASSADRLFGYVISDSKGQHGGDVALRGSLSCGPVTFLLPDDIPFDPVSEQPYSLAPLLSAKPNSARRFLTSPEGKNPTDPAGQPLARGEYYSQGQLLGAAAFPTHRLLLGKTDFPISATQRVPTKGMSQDNDQVALTVNSWIKPGSILTCSLTFSNITKSELGALLWILNPRNLVPESERDDGKAVGFLKMGLGKPLGLGAIEVQAVGLHVRTGKELAEGYETLDACLSLGELRPVDFSHYPLPFEENLLKTPWVRALQRSAFGYGDNIPVRYMTLSENKENNQTDFKTGRPKPGRAQSPASLAACDPQPLEVPRPPERNTGHKPWDRKPGRHW